ncbi:MAG: hypothetical protein M1276_07565 [Deltaproteobacteria bacterium]|nr:hypothetical protein [Deltaproteobacteria bacterium]
MPPLAALTAYLLTLYITGGKKIPSLLSGYIFGFSPYMIGQMTSHLHLVPVFLIPLILLFAVLRMQNKLKKHLFVVLLSICLVFQFLFSLEIFATAAFFGFVLWLILYIANPNLNLNLNSNDHAGPKPPKTTTTRYALKSISIEILTSYAIAAVVLSPYLFYYFAGGSSDVIHFAPADYSSNLLNFFIPSTYTLLGGKFFAFISKTFDYRDYVFDQDAYIGIPLIAVIIIYSKNKLSRKGFKPNLKSVFSIPVYFLITVLIFSIGPTLHIGAHSIMPMPWKIFINIPLIRHAMPVRFMNYAFLDIGIITALFLSKNSPNSKKFSTEYSTYLIKYPLVLIGILFILPTFIFNPVYTPNVMPKFFSSGAYKKFIKKGSTVLFLPYGYNGYSLLYQEHTDFYFKTASGYLGATPEYFENFPIHHSFYDAEPIPNESAELKRFLSSTAVKYIILPKPVNPFFFRLLGKLYKNKTKYRNRKCKYVGGVYIYKLLPPF